MNRWIIIALALALPGCPPPRVPTGSECPTGETRLNCGLCTSDRACVWCASPNGAVVGCYDRARPVECPEGSVVRVPEACEAFPEAQVLPPAN
jgi:hypothetical protein